MGGLKRKVVGGDDEKVEGDSHEDQLAYEDNIRRRKAKSSEDNQVHEYELIPRRLAQPKKKRKTLSRILPDGKVERGLAAEPKDQKFSPAESVKEEQAQSEAEKQKVYLLGLSKEDAARKTGSLCSFLLENPHKYSSYLKDVLILCDHGDSDVVMVAIASMAAVLKDIVPDYKIITQQEFGTQKTSKQTKAFRSYEMRLLSTCKSFIAILRKGAKKALAGTSRGRIGLVCLRSISDLLAAHPEFNYRSDLLKALVSVIGYTEPTVLKEIKGAFEALFAADSHGYASLELVRRSTEAVHNGGYTASAEVYAPFLKLSFKGDEIQDVVPTAKHYTKKERAQMSKAQYKAKKQNDEVDRELALASAEQDKDERIQVQTEILQVILLAYLRVLSAGQAAEHFFDVCLKGLGRFAANANAEFLVDVLAYLRRLCTKRTRVSTVVQASLSAAQLLKSAKDAVIVDQKDFDVGLYWSLLAAYSASPEDFGCYPQLIEAAGQALRRREIPDERLAAFCRRAFGLACLLPQSYAALCVQFAHQILHDHTLTNRLLDADCFATGVVRPDFEDPDFSNSYAMPIWENALLHRHFNPAFVKYAGRLENAESIDVAAMNPNDLRHVQFGKEKRVRKNRVPFPRPGPLTEILRKVAKF